MKGTNSGFGIKGFIAGLLIGALGITSAFAAGGIKSAEYNANRILFNGKELDLKGRQLISIIGDDEVDTRNYMPVRGVLEALGYTVDWDETTNTVIVTASEKTNDFSSQSGNKSGSLPPSRRPGARFFDFSFIEGLGEIPDCVPYVGNWHEARVSYAIARAAHCDVTFSYGSQGYGDFIKSYSSVDGYAEALMKQGFMVSSYSTAGVALQYVKTLSAEPEKSISVDLSLIDNYGETAMEINIRVESF